MRRSAKFFLAVFAASLRGYPENFSIAVWVDREEIGQVTRGSAIQRVMLLADRMELFHSLFV